MKINLIDYNREMVAAWKVAFDSVPEVEIVQNSAFAIPTECITSPANGFGFMDGGFDATITEYLGPQTQSNVQRKIQEEYDGELLVGQAFYVETGSKLIPYCISAPTMRVPMLLGEKSVNAYLAARAIFLILRRKDLPFKSVTIPGLGTGVGRVPYDICAHQMRVAYELFYLGKNIVFPSWKFAQDQHQYLCKSNAYKDLQFK